MRKYGNALGTAGLAVLTVTAGSLWMNHRAGAAEEAAGSKRTEQSLQAPARPDGPRPPEGGFGGGGFGGPGMPGMPPQAMAMLAGMMGGAGGGAEMAVAEGTVYVLRGNNLVALDARTLKIRAEAELPHPQGGMGFGRPFGDAPGQPGAPQRPQAPRRGNPD